MSEISYNLKVPGSRDQRCGSAPVDADQKFASREVGIKSSKVKTTNFLIIRT